MFGFTATMFGGVLAYFTVLIFITAFVVQSNASIWDEVP